MRARPLGRVRRQCSKRSANAVKAASAGVSIGVDIGSISQIDHEMGLYLRSTTLQMSRTLTGSTRANRDHYSLTQKRKPPHFWKPCMATFLQTVIHAPT